MANQAVISIDIKDEKFQQFLATFEKYKETLEKMPDMWKKIGAAADDAAQSSKKIFATASNNLNSIHQATDKLARQYKKMFKDMEDSWTKISRSANNAAGAFSKATKENKDNAKVNKDNNKSLDESNEHLKTMGKFFTGLSETVKDTFSPLAKMLGLIGIPAAFTWGITQDVTEKTRTAQGLGVTTGELRSAETHFERYVDVGAALNRIVQMRQSLREAPYLQRWAGRDLNKSPAELLTKAMVSAIKEWKAHPTKETAEALGLTKLFSIEELNRLVANEKDLVTQIEQYNKDKTSLDMSPESQRSFQDFKTAVTTLGNSLKVFSATALLPIVNYLQRVADALKDITGFFSEWGKDPAEALGHLTRNISVGIAKKIVEFYTPAKQEEVQQPGFWERFKRAIKGETTPVPGAVPSAVPGGASLPGATLAERNLNPGNLRFAGQAGAVLGENGFARFPSLSAGFVALRNQLMAYTQGTPATHGRKLDTLADIIATYAPPTQNDTAAYIQAVEAATGHKGGEHFGGAYTLQSIMPQLIAAIANRESGKNAYSPASVQVVLQNATGGSVNASVVGMQGVGAVLGGD